MINKAIPKLIVPTFEKMGNLILSQENKELLQVRQSEELLPLHVSLINKVNYNFTKKK